MEQVYRHNWIGFRDVVDGEHFFPIDGHIGIGHGEGVGVSAARQGACGGGVAVKGEARHGAAEREAHLIFVAGI